MHRVPLTFDLLRIEPSLILNDLIKYPLSELILVSKNWKNRRKNSENLKFCSRMRKCTILPHSLLDKVLNLTQWLPPSHSAHSTPFPTKPGFILGLVKSHPPTHAIVRILEWKHFQAHWSVDSVFPRNAVRRLFWADPWSPTLVGYLVCVWIPDRLVLL